MSQADQIESRRFFSLQQIMLGLIDVDTDHASQCPTRDFVARDPGALSSPGRAANGLHGVMASTVFMFS